MLFDAYEKQEKEIDGERARLRDARERVAELEQKLQTARELAESRDRENRNLEEELLFLRKEKEKYEPRTQELTLSLRAEKERYSRLFVVAEELEVELKQARRAIEVRDEWFRRHLNVFGDLHQAVEDWKDMAASSLAKGGVTLSGLAPAQKGAGVQASPPSGQKGVEG